MEHEQNNMSVLKTAVKELSRVRECLQIFVKELKVEKQEVQDKLNVLKGSDTDPGDQEIGRSQVVNVIRQQTNQLSSSLDDLRRSNSDIAASVEKELSDLLVRNSNQKQRIIDFSIKLCEEEDSDPFESSGDTIQALEPKVPEGGDFNDFAGFGDEDLEAATTNSTFSID
jgi:hypothetical protein